ncbi:MAG TPA: helix-turn-helix transcriptional regulator, partial [Streptomyces sp.]
MEEFAARLRDLKDRSGLSYGALAKRLHMSTSTLHRYCNGTAVPTEYAPVERLARACKATPEELVDLHRQWILADTARRRRAGTTGPSTGTSPTPDDPDDTDEASPTRTTPSTDVPGAPATPDTIEPAEPVVPVVPLTPSPTAPATA